MEQRKKGFILPFLKNNSQGKPTQNEPIMTETLGKLLRKQPIKCWGSEGDHMYRDFPQRGEGVNIVHNVQQVDKFEDMGRSIPRTYAALENKQAEF
jgi:hypothetical protein